MSAWIVFVFVALLALIPANIASKKGGSFVAWWIFGFLVWIVALPAALMKRDHRYGECPCCHEQIRVEALVCPHCRLDVIPAGRDGLPDDSVRARM